MFEMNKRILSAIVLIPVCLFVVFIGGFFFNLVLVALVVLLCCEYFLLLNKIDRFDLFKSTIPYLLLYISFAISSIISIRMLDNGAEIILYLLIVTWLTDSMAYFGGKYFGGPKLLPKISPNKTISGSFVAFFSVFIFSLVSFLFTIDVSLYFYVCLTLFISFICQVGDYLESYIKRKLNIKDSGNFIPGHGGLFDRLDGFLLVSVCAFFIFIILGLKLF